MEAVSKLLQTLLSVISEAFKVVFVYRSAQTAEKLKQMEEMEERREGAEKIKRHATRKPRIINRVLDKWYRD